MPGVDFRVSHDGAVALVHCSGELDISAAFAFRDVLDAAVADGARILVLDFGKVAFVDSTGLSAVFRARRRLDQVGGQIVIAGIQARVVHRLFEVSGADQLVDVFASVEDALASVARSG